MTSPTRDGERTDLEMIATEDVTIANATGEDGMIATKDATKEIDSATDVVNQVLAVAVKAIGVKRNVETTVTLGDDVMTDLRVRVGVTESGRRVTGAVSRTIGEGTIGETTEIVTGPDEISTTGLEIATNVLEIASSIVLEIVTSIVLRVIVNSIVTRTDRETENSTALEIVTSIAREIIEIEDGDVTKIWVLAIDRRATRLIDVIGTLTIDRGINSIGEMTEAVTTEVVSQPGIGGRMTGVNLKMTGAGEVCMTSVFR